jgi:hypothetical protein
VDDHVGARGATGRRLQLFLLLKPTFNPCSVPNDIQSLVRVNLPSSCHLICGRCPLPPHLHLHFQSNDQKVLQFPSAEPIKGGDSEKRRRKGGWRVSMVSTQTHTHTKHTHTHTHMQTHTDTQTHAQTHIYAHTDTHGSERGQDKWWWEGSDSERGCG